VTDESVITHHANDRTDYWSFLKFRGNIKIPWLGSKFHGLRTTVGPSHNPSIELKWLNLLSAFFHISWPIIVCL